MPTDSPARLVQNNPSNAALIRRLLALAWRYRLDCIRVVVQQVLLVSLGLAGLGLVGLAIDVIRHALDAQVAAPAGPGAPLCPPTGRRWAW